MRLVSEPAEPVDSPGRRVEPQVVALEEGVVPEHVEADARIEAEVEEREREEPHLVIRAEREEVVERGRHVGAFGGRQQGADGAADQELAREVDGREENPRDPQRDVSRGRRGRRAPFVVGERAPGRRFGEHERRLGGRGPGGFERRRLRKIGWRRLRGFGDRLLGSSGGRRPGRIVGGRRPGRPPGPSAWTNRRGPPGSAVRPHRRRGRLRERPRGEEHAQGREAEGAPGGAAEEPTNHNGIGSAATSSSPSPLLRACLRPTAEDEDDPRGHEHHKQSTANARRRRHEHTARDHARREDVAEADEEGVDGGLSDVLLYA